MLVSSLDRPCAQVNVAPSDLQVTFPGGAAVSSLVPILAPSPIQVAQQLMAAVNAALAPVVPIFDLIDVARALFAVAQAIPDAITHLDPSGIAQALPDLGQKIARLLPLVPQASVPLMVLGVVDVLLAFLSGLSIELAAIVAQQARIQRSADRASQLGNVQLHAAVSCAQTQLASQLTGLSAAIAPVARLLSLASSIGALIGLAPLPAPTDLGSDVQAALTSVDQLTATLRAYRAAIPVP